MNEVIKNIFNLFLNRFDCYLIQNTHGFVKVDEPLTYKVIQNHLQHKITVAIYQLDKDSKIKWICFDFDDGNAQTNAQKLYDYLISKKLFRHSTLLEYTGGRGYHVWVFFKQKISAAAGKILCQKILDRCNLSCEFFPKQTKLSAETPYGAAVRLPLGFHRKYSKPSQLISPSSLDLIQPTILSQALINKLESQNSIEGIEVYPPEAVELKNRVRCPAIGDLLQGVEEGVRDVAAFALARFYRGLGLTFEETQILLTNWNNKNRPPLDLNQLTKCIKQAYHKKYGFGCNSFADPLLESFCGKYREKCLIKTIKDKKSEPFQPEVLI